MKRFLVAAPFAIALATTFALGCASSATEQTANTTAPVTAAPADNAPDHARPFDPMARMDETLAKANVALRPEQKTAIEKIFADARAVEKDRLTKLATQIEQGKVDPSTLPARSNVRAAVDAVLDAPQRQALEAAHPGFGHEHGREHGVKDEGEGKAKHMHGRGFGRMGHDLNLTPDQKQKIHDAMQAEGKDGDHMVRFFEAAAPVLTQEQRATLAASLREKAAR